MKRIYKYKVFLADNFDIELPKGARILTVQVQGDEPYIWAEVDDDAPKERRKFRLAGTGHPLDEAPSNLTRVYIGTVQIREGRLVFHLFELLS